MQFIINNFLTNQPRSYVDEVKNRWLNSMRPVTVFAAVLGSLYLVGCEKGSQSEQVVSQENASVESVVEKSSASMESVESDLIAKTQYGPVRGFEDDGVKVFKGVRYGADTATTRFQAPKAPKPWSEVKDALEYGNSTRQVPTGSGGGLFASWKPEPVPALSEDSLFLNVWTPALRDGKKRPVMVWFHGGGFTSGSGSSQAYDGVRLANRGDVVVVTVNHRLNYFGYLNLAHYGEKFIDSGAAGILDLVASLKWVRDNIAEFGGDPNNVLIFGESGGGMKVSTLLAMDKAKGLFHKAVVQSGPAITLAKSEDSQKAAALVVEKLGLTEDTINDILSMSPEKIETAARAVAKENRIAVGSSPTVDGRNIPRHPFLEGAPPQSADVPVLIGTTRTEMSLLAGSRDPKLFDITWGTLPQELSKLDSSIDSVEAIKIYKEENSSIGAVELYFTAATDRGFLNRSVELAEKKSQQAGAPTYFYLLNWDTPVDNGKWFSPHALEIGMVFDNVEKSASMSGTSDEAQRIADLMSEAWLAFAKTGNPNHKDLPNWPEYNAENHPVMVFDVDPAVVNDPHGKQRRVFLSQ
ncbi:MAG: carboxylesterase/lipase family protein [Cellvibrionaceae bacterium]